MRVDRKYLIWALCYAIAGMGLGIYMAASHRHEQHVTHAHLLLLGFVVSLVYGVIHRLWLNGPGPGIARAQFVVHQFGVLGMCGGLFLLYGGVVEGPVLEPLLGVASIAVLLGAVLMLRMVLTSRDDTWA